MTKLRISEQLSLPLDWIEKAGGRVHAVGPRTKTYTAGEIAERIWRQVEKTDTCWLWRGYTRNGYGVLSINDGPRYLHRLVYLMYVGPLLSESTVCHQCDTPRCLRPDHLFAGTQADNVADMRAKGRARYVAVRGAQHGRYRISDDIVIAVRRSYETDRPKQRDLASRFGLTQGTVWAIVNRRGRFAA